MIPEHNETSRYPSAERSEQDAVTPEMPDVVVPEADAPSPSGTDGESYSDRKGKLKRLLRGLGAASYRGYRVASGMLVFGAGWGLLEGQSNPSALTIAAGVTAIAVGAKRFLEDSNPYDSKERIRARVGDDVDSSVKSEDVAAPEDSSDK